jgi:protein-disulfide isomerase
MEDKLLELLTVYEWDHVRGPADAPFTLIEYGDYECPDCGRLFQSLRAIQDEMGPKLRLIYRHYPYSGIHKHAQQAAEAAEAASAQGRFWEMHDMLFENQAALERKHLLDYAQRLQLDVERVRKELKDETHFQRVRKNFIEGVQNGVNGTPGLFLNGVRQQGSFDEAHVRAMLTWDAVR